MFMFCHRAVVGQHAGTLSLEFNRCISQTSALLESKNVPGVYVANIEGRQNSSPILLGLTDYFERHMSSVGFFQPVRLQLLMFIVVDQNLYFGFVLPSIGVWGTLPQLNLWTIAPH